MSANLTRLSEVRSLVMDLGFHPSRALGQNFLVDRNILDILLDWADIGWDEHVLEVGPGLGVVTEEMLKRGARVTAIEKDHRLFAYLSEVLNGCDGLNLLEGDALDVGIDVLLAKGARKVVSNLPYSPGSRILMDMVRDEHAPTRIVVTVQLEVAQRITAAVSTKAYGLMGVWCGLHYESELAKVISPNCFWPRPDVKSAIVVMRRRRETMLEADREPLFYDLTRYAFQHRRKQLASSFPKAPGDLALDADVCRGLLEQVGVATDARPEALTVEQWCRFVSARRQV